MMTYLILNLLFFVTIIMFTPDKLSRPSKKWWLTLAIIIGLTAIFDPIIVALDIVAYDPAKVLGIYFFGAPIEDFFYALYAAILLPLVWQRFERVKK